MQPAASVGHGGLDDLYWEVIKLTPNDFKTPRAAEEVGKRTFEKPNHE